MVYAALLYLHIIGATIILGTGSGMAFFMLVAHLSKDVAFIARTAGIVVLAERTRRRLVSPPCPTLPSVAAGNLAPLHRQ